MQPICCIFIHSHLIIAVPIFSKVGVGGASVGRGPVGQPVVNGHHDGVLEQLGEDHHEHHEEATGRQVAPAHLPGDL